MKEILQKITSDPVLESGWLHTLSLLEHIGARKISKSMGSRHPDEVTLRHLADEARHALAFKRLACLVGASEKPSYLCAEEAVSYFQTLDQKLDAWVRLHNPADPAYVSYLLVTAVIEKRAMKVYPLYRATTQNASVKDELQQIILEEVDHKPDIEERAQEYLLKQGYSLESVVEIEEALYDRFESCLAQSVLN